MGKVVEKLTCAFWALLAAAILFYGTGEFDLITVVLYDKRLFRPLVNLGLASLAFNGALFIYLYAWLEGVRGVYKPHMTVRWAAPAGGVTFATAVFSFIFGLWPVFGFLSLPMVVIVTYGLIMSINFLPSFGLLSTARRKQA